MKKSLFIVGILLFVSWNIIAEQNDVQKVKYTVGKLSDKDEKMLEFRRNFKKYGYESLDILKGYFSDSNDANRIGVYSRLKGIADESNPEIKREIVELLVGQLKDTKNIDVLYKILSRYPLYFSAKAKKQLVEYLEKAITNNEYMVKKYLIELAGIANTVEAKPMLEKYAEIESEKERKNVEEEEKIHAERLKRFKETETEIQKKVYETRKWFHKSTNPSWVAKMALARMGEKKYIDECIDIMSKSYLRKNEEFNNMTKLEYIRQPETIDILIKYLNCDLDNGHTPKTTFSQYAADALSNCLDSFPIKRGEFRSIYPLEEVEIIRKWVKENYSPKLIKSLSVLIDGKIVNNFEPIQTASVKEKIKTHTETKAPEIKENKTSIYVICAIILILISGFVAFSVLKKKK